MIRIATSYPRALSTFEQSKSPQGPLKQSAAAESFISDCQVFPAIRRHLQVSRPPSKTMVVGIAYCSVSIRARLCNVYSQLVGSSVSSSPLLSLSTLFFAQPFALFHDACHSYNALLRDPFSLLREYCCGRRLGPDNMSSAMFNDRCGGDWMRRHPQQPDLCLRVPRLRIEPNTVYHDQLLALDGRHHTVDNLRLR
ncbi:hypothetical protein C8F01DRAFT_164472 [Mycena amicta]|nr:hypothetical protein C8F01DRAFT_164472 [Mycena amicta]